METGLKSRMKFRCFLQVIAILGLLIAATSEAARTRATTTRPTTTTAISSTTIITTTTTTTTATTTTRPTTTTTTITPTTPTTTATPSTIITTTTTTPTTPTTTQPPPPITTTTAATTTASSTTIATTTAAAGTTAPILGHKIAVYWGQSTGRGERTLGWHCANSEFDIIPLAFLHVFFNSDGYPLINLSGHCNELFSTRNDLLHCPAIALDIDYCQRVRQKKIILSLGGAVGSYGFQTATKASQLAQNIWNMFLGGSSQFRPFDSAVLDGIDLDIEGGSGNATLYGVFVAELRQLMNSDPGRTYIITAAPQCPFPDEYLGPDGAKVLSSQGHLFDHIYVQFYNNYCYPGSSYFNFDVWHAWAVSKTSNGKGPKIFVGLPASPNVGSAIYYKTPAEVQQIYQSLRNYPNMGGFMLWDAGYDYSNTIDGMAYSYWVRAVLNSGAVPVTAATTTAASTAPTASTASTTGSTTVVCESSASLQVDPNNCYGYIHCAFWVPNRMACPSGLCWNQSKQYCDWPSNCWCSTG